MVQHRPLVDRALVGDLSSVERKGRFQENHPRHAGCRPGCLAGMGGQPVCGCPAHRRMREQCLPGKLRYPGQGAQGRPVGDDKSAQFMVSFPGNDDIACKAFQFVGQRRPKRPDGDPCARCELEVFGKASVENNPGRQVVRVGRTEGVTEPVEAFLVESLACQLRIAPVTGRHGRALHPALQVCRPEARVST